MAQDRSAQDLGGDGSEGTKRVDVPKGAATGPSQSVHRPRKLPVHQMSEDPANAPCVRPDVEPFVPNQLAARGDPPGIQDEQGKPKGDAATDEFRIELVNHPRRIPSGLHYGAMTENSSWDRRHWAYAALLGAALCVAVMGDNIRLLKDVVPGYFNDDWSNGIYLHHQVHAALMAGRLDLFDPLQFHPFGYNPIHTNGGNVLEMLVSGFTRLILPWPMWLGVAGLLWIPLNLLAFIPLARRLWTSPHAILAGAAVWTLFPPALAQFAAGRWTQVALIGVPITIAGLLDITEKDDRSGVGLTAIGLAVTGLGYWFNALFLGLLLPVFWWHGARFRDRKAVAVDLLAAGGLALALVTPFLVVIFWPALAGDGMPGTHIDPTEMNIVFGDALRLVGAQKAGLANWLPYGLIVGLLLTAWRGHRRALWLLLAGVCIVFSMGPGQPIGEHVVRMPYWFLWKGVPGLSRMFHPERWILIGGLFLTIASVDGLARHWPRWAWLLPIAVVAQLWIRGVTPLGTWRPEIPDHWQLISEESDRGAIIVVPLHRSQLVGAYQRSHGRALYGGMVEDQPWAHPKEWRVYEESSALLRSLRAISYGYDQDVVIEPADIQRLRKDGFSRVVWDGFSWTKRPHRVDFDPVSKLTSALGAPMYQSDGGVVWELRSP